MTYLWPKRAVRIFNISYKPHNTLNFQPQSNNYSNLPTSTHFIHFMCVRCCQSLDFNTLQREREREREYEYYPYSCRAKHTLITNLTRQF